MQPNTPIVIKSRNKASDLKKLMQLACKTDRTQITKTETLLSSKGQLFSSERSRVNKTSGTNSIITQLKQLNMKKGLTNVSLKNKENQCINKKSSNLATSISSLNTQTSRSLKQLKIQPIAASLQMCNPLKGLTCASTTNRQKKNITHQYPRFRIPAATSREKSPEIIPQQKIGFKISDFSLGKKLGKGRFGSVRLAQDKATRFILAIKTINICQLKQSEMEQQLIQQVKLQTFCNHPNILKMFGCFSDSKNIYLLLELGSECLFQEVRAERHFSEEKTAYYIKQVIESLKYIHSESIIHRDIKPENILSTQGVLKLSDFGWSTYSPSVKRHTFCGTLAYVSPQIVAGDYYDQKVDIWSLGVLCYELAVGKSPFQDPAISQQATYNKILSANITFPQTISPELEDLISKILLKNPQERPSISQIQNHAWLQRYKTAGRFISKQIWELWQGLNHQ